jgi:hypothetical protein
LRPIWKNPIRCVFIFDGRRFIIFILRQIFFSGLSRTISGAKYAF